ncbi:hypothetical protein E4N04_19465 [Salmonella enterica]|nr:hypothetical protein [Salmonella enterica]
MENWQKSKINRSLKYQTRVFTENIFDGTVAAGLCHRQQCQSSSGQNEECSNLAARLLRFTDKVLVYFTINLRGLPRQGLIKRRP